MVYGRLACSTGGPVLGKFSYVEVSRHGGIGRTGTAFAALAVLDGLTPGAAPHWVRADYHRRAVQTPWQRRWLTNVRPSRYC